MSRCKRAKTCCEVREVVGPTGPPGSDSALCHVNVFNTKEAVVPVGGNVPFSDVGPFRASHFLPPPPGGTNVVVRRDGRYEFTFQVRPVVEDPDASVVVIAVCVNGTPVRFFSGKVEVAPDAAIVVGLGVLALKRNDVVTLCNQNPIPFALQLGVISTIENASLVMECV